MAKLDWYIRAGLKLRHLQVLVALDDLRNQGKVAALMNVTQPACPAPSRDCRRTWATSSLSGPDAAYARPCTASA